MAEPASNLVELLRATPEAFEFVQAVRLLRAARAIAATTSDPAIRDATPAARFIATPSLGHGSTELARGPADADDGLNVSTLATNFIGLHGPSGVLPADVTSAVRTLGRDSSLTQVLDFFNDRLARAFYRASEAGMPVAQFERARLGTAARGSTESDGVDDLLGTLMLALGGGERRAANRDRRSSVHERAILRSYATVLRRRPVASSTLQAILRAELGLPVVAIPMMPMSAPVERSSRFRLGRGGAIVGKVTQQIRWTVLIRIGPIDFATYRRLLPGRRLTRRIGQLVRYAIGPNCDYAINLILAADQAPPWSLPARGHARAAGVVPKPQAIHQLGRDLWLGRPPRSGVDGAKTAWRLRRDFAGCHMTSEKLRRAGANRRGDLPV